MSKTIRADAGTGPTYAKLASDPSEEETKGRTRLMHARDSINNRWRRNTLHLASAGTFGRQREWVMKQERKTLVYLTDWAELVTC